jgi:hypothetical protein
MCLVGESQAVMVLVTAGCVKQTLKADYPGVLLDSKADVITKAPP